jgi:hypothetical protein
MCVSSNLDDRQMLVRYDSHSDSGAVSQQSYDYHASTNHAPAAPATAACTRFDVNTALSNEEVEFIRQGGGGDHKARLNTLVSMLHRTQSQVIRHLSRIRSKGRLIEAIASATLLRTSSGQPDCFLSIIQLSTVRVISIPASASTSATRARLH